MSAEAGVQTEARPRRLVLLRHGLTSWNAERRFQGQADIDLTEVGHVQAKAVAESMAGYDPVALWSSDLARARQTAAYVAEATGLTPALDPRLREIDVGRFEGLSHERAVERYGAGPWDFSQYGGESAASAGERMAEVITQAAAALPPGGAGVIVAHGAVIRHGVLKFLGWPAEQVSTIGPLDNCAWVELVHAVGTWQPGVRWRLSAYNLRTPIS